MTRGPRVVSRRRRSARETLLATIVVVAPPAATAVPPPMTGNVSCALTADSTFRPPIGYQRGKIGPAVGPLVDAKWKVVGELTGCTGTQAGGRPTRPGPIARGELLLRARGVQHSCETLSANGMTSTFMRIKWFDALGNALLPTRATGTVGVAGLGNGSMFLSDFPPVLDPNFVPPGVITFNMTATSLPDARAFPGSQITLTAVADQTVWMMPLRCSLQTPPVNLGIGGLGFHGVQGPSSISIG